MDSRFVRVYAELEQHADAEGSWTGTLARCDTERLVAALAGCSSRNAVEANVIATEVLNRVRRAPFLGAGLVSATSAILILVLDFVYTGTPVFLEAGARAYVLTALLLATTLTSVLALVQWRGGFRRRGRAVFHARRSREW